MLRWWGQLGEAERLQLVSELEEVDLAEMEHMWRTTCGEDSTAARDRDMSSMAPVGECIEELAMSPSLELELELT